MTEIETAVGAGDPDRPVLLKDVVCEARDEGWTCTLRAGHEGEHRAYGIYDNLLHRWPQKPKTGVP